jgi:Acyl-CoA dehydrogenase, C-terminal domain
MDLRPDTEQKGILEAVSTLLRRTAGPQRARAADGAGDPAALARLAEAGFCDIADSGERADRLTALLVVEQAARFLVPAPVGARTLASAYTGLKDPPLMIALASGNGSLARYGADADIVLMLGDGTLWRLDQGDFTAQPAPTRMSFPLARVTARPGRGVDLGPEAAGRLTRVWRVLLAAEIGAAMASALEVARSHVQVRVQFGHPIGSLQAVQHTLARAHVTAQGAMWLARRAAWDLDSDADAALAATHATAGAAEVFDAVHQVTGAIGFTREFDLHLWSLRLPVLAAELGGPQAHAAAASAAQWPAPRAAGGRDHS